MQAGGSQRIKDGRFERGPSLVGRESALPPPRGARTEQHQRARGGSPAVIRAWLDAMRLRNTRAGGFLVVAVRRRWIAASFVRITGSADWSDSSASMVRACS